MYSIRKLFFLPKKKQLSNLVITLVLGRVRPSYLIRIGGRPSLSNTAHDESWLAFNFEISGCASDESALYQPAPRIEGMSNSHSIVCVLDPWTAEKERGNMKSFQAGYSDPRNRGSLHRLVMKVSLVVSELSRKHIPEPL